MTGALKIEWRDGGREPQGKPNAAFPDGIDVDASGSAAVTCQTDLPYPAKRCGVYIVRCGICGISAAITTAGRPDARVYE